MKVTVRKTDLNKNESERRKAYDIKQAKKLKYEKANKGKPFSNAQLDDMFPGMSKGVTKAKGKS